MTKHVPFQLSNKNVVRFCTNPEDTKPSEVKISYLSPEELEAYRKKYPPRKPSK